MILATSFITLGVIYGVWYSYSVFLVALVREFGWSRSLVSGAFAFFSLIHGGLGPPVGWLLRRVGPRRVILAGVGVMAVGLILTAQTTVWWHLYLAFGVVTALGISLNGWIPVVVLIQGWFPDRMGSAMGLASAGIGVGIFAFVPLSQVLIDWCGWRWTFGILAAVTVAWGLPSAFWLIQDPPAFSMGSSKPGGSRRSEVSGVCWTIGTAVKSWRFWGLAGVYFMGNFVTQMLMIHYVYAGLNAFGYGVLSPVFPAIASDLFRGPGFSTIYGSLYTAICIGLAAGPWAAGQIFDLTGSYSMALWLGLVMAVVSPALLWIVGPRRPNPPPLKG